jgi:hypothetical protein
MMLWAIEKLLPFLSHLSRYFTLVASVVTKPLVEGEGISANTVGTDIYENNTVFSSLLFSFFSSVF